VSTNDDTPGIHPALNGWGEADEASDPYVSWSDWEYHQEPGYPDDHRYPQDAQYPREPEYGPEPGYRRDLEYPQDWAYPQFPGQQRRPEYEGGAEYRAEPEYPRGPGFAPVPDDHPFGREPGYRAGPGYTPEPGYGQDQDYGPDAGYAPDSRYPRGTWNDWGSDAGPVPGYALDPGYAAEPYAADPAYARDAQAVPPMESLAQWAPQAGRPSSASAAPVPDEYQTADSLTAESLLHAKRPGPGSGWRRSLSRVTGGLLRFGESAADMRRRDLINRVRTPVTGGHHRVAVLSLKGGVGKTTTAVGLGATLATLRGDRVVAVDANPDRGTLSDKVRLETAATIRDLLNERGQISRYADVRAFTSQAPSRLEILASDRDPAVSVAFGAEDYCDAARVLEHFYSICLTDCGTGLLHSAMSGVLHLADQIVVVSSPSVDGARSASATLDWLEAHQCGDLVRNGVVVLSTIRPKSKSNVDLDRLEHHFASRCRAVVRIPYDPHLEEGAEVELELLAAETADAYLALAALVGDGLAWPRR